jgi:hypothetical protein
LADQPYKSVAKLISELDEQIKSQVKQTPEGPLSDKVI